MVAITPTGNLNSPVRCKAPCPEDITCGETIASSPTIAPPTSGLTACRMRNRVNACSQAATPRIRAIPNSEASSPTPPAMTTSWTARPDTEPASMPSCVGVKAWAVR